MSRRYDYEEHDYNYGPNDIDEMYEDDDEPEYEDISDERDYWDSYYHNLTDEISDD